MALQSQNLSLNDLISAINESRRTVFLFILVFLLISLVYLALATPIYQADVLLQVEEKSKSHSALAETSQIIEDQVVIPDKVRILYSRRVMGQVVDELHLDVEAAPNYFPIMGRLVAKWNSRGEGVAQPFGDIEEYAWGGEHIEVSTFDVPTGYLSKDFTIMAGQDNYYQLLGPKGNLIGVGQVGLVAEFQLRDGGIVKSFVSELAARPSTKFTVRRIARLKAITNLTDQLRVEQPKSSRGVGPKFGLLRLTLEGDSPEKTKDIVNTVANVFLLHNLRQKFSNADKTLNYLEEQLATVKSQMESAEAGLNKFRLKQGSIDISRETMDVLAKTVQLEAEISELKREREALILKFTPEHTRVLVLDAQIQDLNQELKDQARRIKMLPGIQQEVLRLSREVEVNRQLYTLLLNKTQELKVVKAGAEGDMRIIDQAVTPLEPVSPKPGLAISLSIVLGLLLGVGYALLRKSLLGGVDDPAVIEKQLGLTVYAVVSSSDKQQKLARSVSKNKTRHAVLAFAQPDDFAIEGLRNLRTALDFMQGKVANKTLVITGPSPGVGKSFVSVNIAALWASAGRRVLLVDADLRKGTIHRFFGINPKEGLSNVILGEQDLDSVIHETAIPNLFVIPAGVLRQNPSELLLSKQFSNVLEACNKKYDHVIIDSPPVLGLSDAAIVGQHAAVNIVVVKAGQNSIRELEQTIKNLKQAGINPAGVVFNNMKTAHSNYGYGRYYGYYESSNQ